MATLFDDASLVMIPSGYKDDKLYSIKPVEELGGEEVTNGSFSNGSTNWTLGTGWSVSNGVATHTGSTGNIVSDAVLSINTKYKVVFEIVSISGGVCNIYDVTSGTTYASFDSVGIKSATITKDSSGSLAIRSSSSNAVIDNVSVREAITSNGDFTFSRDGSGASPATRVNSAGLIEKGRTNLLLQSNSFDTTWTQSDITTLTSGQSGYDGSNDAWLVEKSASSNGYLRQNISSSGVHTFSLYAKSNSLNGVLIQTRGASTKSAQFDLSTGTLGTAANNIDAKIEDIGSGWYRCYVSVNDSAITQVRVFICDDGTTIGTTAGSIYIQDAQLEKGLVSTSVIETTTAAASAGILGDMPRLDYSGGASCPSLLLEPSRTNLITQSEYFDSWFYKTGISITSNDTTSPEGVSNGSKLETTAAGSRYVGNNYTLSTGDNSFSVFAKKGTTNWIYLNVVKDGGNNWNFTFDLENGTLGQSLSSAYSVDASIEDYGSGWYRITATANVTSAGLFTARIYPADSATDVSTSIGDNVYIYGAQLEAGSYPTSYVPTYGSATARGEDVCINAGDSSTFNTSEGVLFGELKAFDSLISTNRKIVLGDGSYNNGIEFGFQTTTNQMQFIIRSAGSISMNVTTTAYDVTDYVKFAISYKNNQGKVFINGSQLGSTDTSVTTPATISRLDLRFSTAFEFEGNVKQLLVFNTALTDAELAALTTL